MLESRPLGTSPLLVSSIGLGCVTFGREIDRSASFRVLDHAFERGITLFDTAEAYGAGASETVLGDWMAERGLRDRIVLATKVHGPLTREHILQSASESLRRLRTDRIDLFQLHIWDEATPLPETLEALQQLVESRVVRSVGVSNWDAAQLRQALELAATDSLARVQCVQPPYNLVQREIESELLPLCEERGVGVLSYSPLAAGFLTGKYARDQQVPEGSRFDVIPAHQPIYFTDHGFAALDRLRQAAERSGRTMIQLALGWVLQQRRVTSVLVGARHPGHVDQAFDALAIASDELHDL